MERFRPYQLRAHSSELFSPCIEVELADVEGEKIAVIKNSREICRNLILKGDHDRLYAFSQKQTMLNYFMAFINFRHRGK
jgi:hypothetical protein